MSATMQPPGQPGPSGPPAPPGMMPNPAFAMWQQAQQQVVAVQQENAKRQKQFDDAVALIRKDGLRGFKLDIEADSTIAADEQAEKQARIEFMQQFVPLMEQIIPQAQGNPAIASLAKEVTLFAVRGFNVARTLEEAIEQAFDQIAQMQPVPPKGSGAQQNPQIEAAKVQADVQDTQVKAQSQMQDTQAKAQIAMATIAQKQQQAAMEAQSKAAQLQQDDQNNQAKMAMEAAKLNQKERLDQSRMGMMAMRSTQGMV